MPTYDPVLTVRDSHCQEHGSIYIRYKCATGFNDTDAELLRLLVLLRFQRLNDNVGINYVIQL